MGIRKLALQAPGLAWVSVVAVLMGQLCAGQVQPKDVGMVGSTAPDGLETPWAVKKIVADLQKDSGELQPLLRQMNPQQWCDQKGAPPTYVLQWQSAQQQLNDLITVTQLFSQKTESLSLGLDTYFRLEALEVMERSLAEGAQKYDARSTADQLNILIAHNFSNRDRIRGYLRDLATSTEANFKIADQEAQRCRSNLSREPAASPVKRLKKD
jgi:hypothetical protein